MTIRVLLIIPTLDRCGAEKQLTLLASGLPRDQFDVHVCCLTRGGPYREVLERGGIPVTVIGKSWKVDPGAYLRLRRHIASLRPDIVHTWIFAANAYGRQAAVRAGVKHVLAGERCVDPWKRWHELAIDRYLAKRTQRIVTNSNGVVDFYAKHGIAADKFTVIPNGVELSDPSAAGDRQQLLRDLGLESNARLVLAVNRLWPQKRIKDLIWAADLIKCVRDDAHFLIIGDGPQRWRLERFTWQCEITDKVHFLGERDDVARILPHADCLWLGSEYEGQSNAVMEAMASGVPVVASDIPGNRDLVVPGETGYLVPVGDRGEFARKGNILISDEELRMRLGNAGRERMGTEFSIEKMIERHSALYRELVD